MPRSIPTTKHAWFPGGLATVPHRMQIMSVACQPPTCIGWDALGRQSGAHAGPGHPQQTKESNNTASARGTQRPMSWQRRKQCASPNATHTTSVKAPMGPHLLGDMHQNTPHAQGTAATQTKRPSAKFHCLTWWGFHLLKISCAGWRFFPRLWGAGAEFGRAKPTPKQTQLGTCAKTTHGASNQSKPNQSRLTNQSRLVPSCIA